MKELKKPLQAIIMSPDEEVWKSILSKQKQITIRSGFREYELSQAIICNPKINTCIITNITSVKYCDLRGVTSEEFQADGYSSHQEMLKDLKNYGANYVDLTLDSPVTVVRWGDISGKLVEDFSRSPEETTELFAPPFCDSCGHRMANMGSSFRCINCGNSSRY